MTAIFVALFLIVFGFYGLCKVEKYFDAKKRNRESN